MIAPQVAARMIRQVPGKTNEIIWAEITFGRSVAFRHRGWVGRAFRIPVPVGGLQCGI